MKGVKIIGICGKKESGKTTLSEVLVEEGFVIFSFATELKKIATEHFGWNGVKDKEGRKLLQRLGTDCGRAYDPDVWVRKTKVAVATYLFKKNPKIKKIAFDDVRFDNEADLIREFGGAIIQLKKKQSLWGWFKSLFDLSRWHASEKPIHDSLIDYVWKFDNFGSKDEFKDAVRQILKEVIQ